MYDFFDKHGKKTLAVVGSILTIAFLMPTSGLTGGGGGGSRPVGKIGGTTVHSDDVLETQAALQIVSRLEAQVRSPDGSPGQFVSLPQALFDPQEFGPQLGNHLTSNPLLWNLLVREATENGVMPSDQQIDGLLSSPNIYVQDPALAKPVALKDINPARRDEFKPGLRGLLAVYQNFIRRRNAIKFSTPMVDDALAKENEEVRVRLVSFAASDFAKDVAAPTDDELRAQLDAYANDPAGPITNTNPFGFGYRIADKLRLQWIEVPRAEVAKVIEASKSPELWDEDAIIYYQKNQSQFQTTPTVSPAINAGAKPTTRPFAEAKADVLEKLRGPLIEQQQKKIVTRLVQQMSIDAQRIREKAPTTRAAADTNTAYGVPLGSGEYLQKLADAVQKQFGVKLTVATQGTPITQAELAVMPGIGGASVEDAGSPYGVSDASKYIFEHCKPLVSDQTRLGLFDLLQPTKVLEGSGSMYVARAIAVEPSHAPRSLDEVRPVVEKDVRAKKSFAKAAEAAQKFLDSASAAGGFEKTSGQRILTTDWFGGDAYELPGAKAIADGYQLVTPIFDQLRGLNSPNELPRRTLVKRQAKGSAVAVELFAVRTKLNTEKLTQQKMMAMRTAMQSVVSMSTDQALINDWFSMDGVSRRLGFVPAEGGPNNAPANKPGGPVNPFVPG